MPHSSQSFHQALPPCMRGQGHFRACPTTTLPALLPPGVEVSVKNEAQGHSPPLDPHRWSLPPSITAFLSGSHVSVLPTPIQLLGPINQWDRPVVGASNMPAIHPLPRGLGARPCIRARVHARLRRRHKDGGSEVVADPTGCRRGEPLRGLPHTFSGPPGWACLPFSLNLSWSPWPNLSDAEQEL